jgi:hypothetical protein
MIDLCSHQRKELRQRADAAGRRIYQYQCLDCGARVSTAVAAAKALAHGQPSPFDQELYEKGQRDTDQFYQKQAAEAHALFAARQLKEYQAYEAYLQTDAWRAKRAEALKRDGGVCQGCRTQRATQVHHLTYAHLGDELLFELISVCDDCHLRIHADRASAS